MNLETEVKRYRAAKAHWADFCETYPELGLSGSYSSWVWFARRFSARMLDAGALTRGPNKTLLTDPDRFNTAAYALLTRQAA